MRNSLTTLLLCIPLLAFSVEVVVDGAILIDTTKHPDVFVWAESAERFGGAEVSLIADRDDDPNVVNAETIESVTLFLKHDHEKFMKWIGDNYVESKIDKKSVEEISEKVKLSVGNETSVGPTTTVRYTLKDPGKDKQDWYAYAAYFSINESDIVLWIYNKDTEKIDGIIEMLSLVKVLPLSL